MSSFSGKTLLENAVNAANESKVFSEVFVSSEDAEILAHAAQLDCTALRRPEELGSDPAQVKHVCLHHLNDPAVAEADCDAFAVMLTTNPLRRGEDVRAGYHKFRETNADVLMSVVPFDHPPQRALAIRDGLLTPAFSIAGMQRTQKLEPLYRHDGSFIFQRIPSFMATGEFYSGRIKPFVIDANRSVDIDEELHLQWAEFLAAYSRQYP